MTNTCPYCLPSKPDSVEIWRYSDRILTVAQSGCGAFNTPNFTLCRRQHEGVWSSRYMCFMPSDTFTDGTPVALYEGLAPIADEEAVL